MTCHRLEAGEADDEAMEESPVPAGSVGQLTATDTKTNADGGTHSDGGYQY